MELLKLLKTFIISISILASCLSFSQDSGADDIWGETIRDVSIISAVGVGGAILGLSTLSFVDEPKEHLNNIVIGGALGIIVGVGIVAWLQATSGKKRYEGAYNLNSTPLKISENIKYNMNPKSKLPNQFGMSFSF